MSIEIKNFVKMDELTGREVITALNHKNFVYLADGTRRYMKLKLTKWGTFYVKVDGKVRYLAVEMFESERSRTFRYNECELSEINADGTRAAAAA